MPETSEIISSFTAISPFTLASLASASARQSAAINISSTLFDDVVLEFYIPLVSGSPSAGGNIAIYGSPSFDGTNFRGASGTVDAVSGSDGAITLGNPTNLVLLDTLWTPSSGGLTWKSIIVGIAQYFNGWMPPYLSIIVANNTGLAFASSGITAQYATWR